MNKGSFILLAMLLLSGLLQGTSLDLSDKGDWRQPERIELHQGVWRIQGAGKFMTWDTQPVRRGQRYTLSLQVRRAPDSPPAQFYFGFIPCTDEERNIREQMVRAVPGSEGLLSEAVQAGSQSILVKVQDPDCWLNSERKLVAFAACPDWSDLPARYLSPSIASVKMRDDQLIEVCFVSALADAYPTGLGVRLHAGGGNMNLYLGSIREVPEEWTQYQGTIGEQVLTGWKASAWPPGTTCFFPFFMANWNGPENAAIEIRNITLTIEE